MQDKVKFSKTKAHQRYTLADGTPVPGVTTVLGVLNKPALMHWAWEQGRAGLDYRKTKDQAANIGTLAHWLCECHLKGQEPDTSEFSAADIDKAENAALKFMGWWDSAGLVLVGSECQIVSETHRYGGTLDIVACDKQGRGVLVDLKSSKGIYDEYFFQLAAYSKLLPTPEMPAVISRCVIVRIGKEAEDGDFEVQERADLSREWMVFEAALRLHRALGALKNRGSNNSKGGEK